MDFDSYERYLDFETGVLHRIWSRIYLAEWFGLGSHFGRKSPNMRKRVISKNDHVQQIESIYVFGENSFQIHSGSISGDQSEQISIIPHHTKCVRHFAVRGLMASAKQLPWARQLKSAVIITTGGVTKIPISGRPAKL